MNRHIINTAAEFGKVAVVYGGCSAERQVSLWSGAGVLAALQSQGIDAHGVDATGAALLATLQQGHYDRVFIALHGTGGEDGVLQGALEQLNLPYTGSGVLGSCLGMDKLKTKQIWQSLGLPTPSYQLIHHQADLEQVLANMRLPLAIKPIAEGSSIGVSRVDQAADLHPAWVAAGGEHSVVLAESWIVGQGEYTGAVLQGEALPLIRMETDLAFYDFDAKYLREDTRYFCPSGLSEQQESQLCQLMVTAFEAIGGQGWGRVDFVLDEQGHPLLLEVNTVPGMTTHSLVPMAAKELGISYEQLCWRVLETSFR